MELYVMTFLLQHFSSFFPTLTSSLLSFPIRYRIWTTAYVYFHTVFISYNHIWIYMYIYIYINICMRLVMVSFKNGIWYIYFSPSCFFLWKAPHEIISNPPMWFYVILWHGCISDPGLDVRSFVPTWLSMFPCFVVKMNSKISSFPSGYIHTHFLFPQWYRFSGVGLLQLDR